MHLRMISKGIFDVQPLRKELAEHPECWDTIRHRTSHPSSPHREVSDIWVRYNPIENYQGDMAAFNEEHEAEWYPVAEDLPTARYIAETVQEAICGDLGAVLITKIPAGKQVYPHVDGGWHARNFEKFAIQVEGNERQAFHFTRESLVTLPGDLWWFDNSFPHWVKNDSDEDRVTLIVCIRRH